MLSVVDGGLTSIPCEDLDSPLVQALQRESNGLTLGDLKDRLRPQNAIETMPGGDEYVVTNTNAPNSPCHDEKNERIQGSRLVHAPKH